MDQTHNQPSARKFLSWFIPLGRQAGGWAFALSRVTAIGLTFYLFLHLYVLRLLALGPGHYDEFLALTENPIIKFGEWAVVAVVFLYGFNGIRVVLTSFGIGVTRQKQLFYVFMIAAVLVILIFTARMY